MERRKFTRELKLEAVRQIIVADPVLAAQIIQ